MDSDKLARMQKMLGRKSSKENDESDGMAGVFGSAINRLTATAAVDAAKEPSSSQAATTAASFAWKTPSISFPSGRTAVAAAGAFAPNQPITPSQQRDEYVDEEEDELDAYCRELEGK